MEQITLHEEKKISIAIMISFVVLTIQYFILIVFDLLNSSNAAALQSLSKIIVGSLFLYSFPIVFKRSKIKLFITYSVSIFAFLLSILMFSQNHMYIKELIIPFFFMGLPAFIYSMSIKDWDVLKQVMTKASTIVLIFGSVLGILIFLDKATIGVYSMSLSYYMLLPAIMNLDELFDKLSFKSVVFTSLSLLIILALGSRGPILCVLVFIILKNLRPKVFDRKRLIAYFVLVGTTLIIILNFKNILVLISTFLSRFGISSRSITLFLGEGIYVSGRDTIYKTVVEGIANSPFFGIGIGGDRYATEGSYVHNIFLEIIANFGVILGGFFSIILIIAIIKLLLVKDRKTYNMIIIWISLGFVHLMVSSSYLIDIRFWIFMGLALNALFAKEQRSDLKIEGDIAIGSDPDRAL